MIDFGSCVLMCRCSMYEAAISRENELRLEASSLEEKLLLFAREKEDKEEQVEVSHELQESTVVKLLTISCCKHVVGVQ